MLHTPAPAGGNLKLRGLLQTARELLRRRHLKKALNNAQIAEDFAARSQEDPGVVRAARLLRAEILFVNAAYAHDDELRLRGERLLGQLAAGDAADGHATGTAAPDLEYVRGVAAQLADRPAEAARHYAAALRALPHPDPRRATAAVALAGAQALTGLTDPARLGDVGLALAQAETLLTTAPEHERGVLSGRLAMARAQAAQLAGDLGGATEAARLARRYAAAADDRETEARACYFLGRIGRQRGNDVIALRLLYEAMDAAELMGHRPLLVDAHLEIGYVFARLSDDREADKYFVYAAEDALDSGRTDVVFGACYALGVAARRRGDAARAHEYLGRALQAANELAWPREQGVVLGELAGLKLAADEPDLARHLAAEARRRATEAGVAASAKTALTEARLAAADGDHPRCIELTLAAERAAEDEMRDDLRVACLRLRARSLAASGELPAALAAERAAGDLAGSLIESQRDRHLPDLNMRAALRQREREIEKLNREAELKNALVAKTEQIERANRDLVQINEELRQFAYVASHDLKEPLRQIGSYVSLIRRNYAELFDERGEQFFGFVTEGVARLNRLLDSLMHYTSVARIELRIEPVDLEEVVAAARDEIATRIEEQSARVEIAELPVVPTSAALLRHVVAALLDNGVKFARAEVPPVVAVDADLDEDLLTLRVRDNGIGIDPTYADKVFVLFQMLHAKSEYPGTGVGLAIAQKGVQRLGGRIWFEGNREGGTTFSVEVPVGDPSAPAA